jgi:predicted aspartyl protease
LNTISTGSLASYKVDGLSNAITSDSDSITLAQGVTVNGKPAIANVDTGSNGFVLVTPAAVARLGLEPDLARARASRSTGFNGKADNRTGTVDRIAFGTIVVKRPKATFYGPNAGYTHTPWDVRIGSGVLRAFQVTVDYDRGLMKLNRP